MPHIIVEHTANLDDLPWSELLDALHHAAAEMPELPLKGLRSRVVRHETYQIADGDPENAFVHVTLRLGHGRPEEALSRIGEHLFSSLRARLDPYLKDRPVSITLEIDEIHPVHNYRENRISGKSK